jgi:hypothetical protein
MSLNLSRLQVLSMWIELDRKYTSALILNKDYFNYEELKQQMLLTSLYLQKNQEMILAMREVEQINQLLPSLTSASEIEQTILRRTTLSDLIHFHTTVNDYFPYSIEEIFSYVEKIELHQKFLNIPY